MFLERQPFDPNPAKPDSPAGDKHAIRSGRWKYIEGRTEGTRELFDLEADPAERHNRLLYEPDRARSLAEELAAFQTQARRERSAPAISPEDRARLEALGYAQ